MTESWDDYADGWDTNESVVLYSQKAYETLIEKVNIANCRILDFGCGTGLLSEKLSQHARIVVALDPSKKMIAILNNKQLHGVNGVQAELSQQLIDENTHFKEGFDIIVASSSLAFVPDYLNTLHLLKKLLNKNGVLVQWDWLKDTGAPGIGFSEEQLANAMAKVGLNTCSISVPFSLNTGNDNMSVIMVVAKNV